jgi:WD40 repeat protein
VATHGAPVSRVAFSADGSLLASAAEDGSLALRAGNRLLTSDLPIMLPAVHRGSVTGIAFSPDGRVLASLGVDNTVRLLTTQ